MSIRLQESTEGARMNGGGSQSEPICCLTCSWRALASGVLDGVDAKPGLSHNLGEAT